MRRLSVIKFVPAGWFVVLAAFGGASRYDEWQQVIITAASLALLFGMLWTPNLSDIRAKRPLWLFLVAIAMVIALQLIPLPPSIWTRLPGREPFVIGAKLTGLDTVWRPLSLTPDLTWASLFSLLPVAATLLVAPTVGSSALRPLLWTMTAVFLVAALLGLAQTLGEGGHGLYRTFNDHSAIGVFANRNHHAIFLTLAFPVIAYLFGTGRKRDKSSSLRMSIGISIGVLILVSIVQAGSRSGLILSVLMLGCILSWIVLRYLRSAARGGRHFRGARDISLSALIGSAALTIIAAIAFLVGRSVAFDRLIESNPTDYRLQLLPTLTKMAGTFAPLGSGYGSFASVYRHFEPFDHLSYTYLNQAHNDVFQVLIEGGIVGAALMAVMVFGWAWQGFRILRGRHIIERATGVMAFLIVGDLFFASFADYPFRTPLLAAMLVYAGVLMLQPAGALSRSDALR